MSYLQLNRYVKKRTRGLRMMILAGVLVAGYIGSLIVMFHSYLTSPIREPFHYTDSDHNFIHRHLLETPNTTESSVIQGEYPPDAFTLEQKRQGAVILHIIGIIYVFVGLAIICDEFFVPSLGVITEKTGISEDVAGATFMAAGGSAPELFTSLVGVFVRSNVGIGTIVGSAVFNILFVIGMCALFSKQILQLTWWPLFRDVSFYSLDLILLIWFYLDDKIFWWEALVLFLCYIAYVVFMKFNEKVEKFVKSCCKRVTTNKVSSTDTLLKQQGMRRCSVPLLHTGSGRVRHGVLQLMIHTIDPLGAEKVQDKAVALHAVASLQLMINVDGKDGAHQQNGDVDKDNNMQVNVISNGKVSPVDATSPRRSSPSVSQETAVTMVDNPDAELNGKVTKRDVNVSVEPKPETEEENQSNSDSKSEANGWEDEEPLDMSWPDTCRKRLTYVLLAPLVFPMWLMLPDVRRPEKRKWYAVTFIGSILWIGGFAYLMAWWANEAGQTMGIPNEVIGLTVLAAGTSIPDLITSVIVAKKGYGDMAVSSSIGSNIFDITVGLPIPWMLFSAVNSGLSVNVSSKSLLCSIVLLFVMLLAVILTIAISRWRMNKIMGFSMLIFYLVFVTISSLLEFQIIICPDATL